MSATAESRKNDAVVLSEAAAVLRRGGLVAFPTETVYGLGADAENPDALARLYAVKGRPGSHPVIVHLSDAGQLSEWAVNIPDIAWQLAHAFWPGPLTLILERSRRVPDAVTGGQNTVGLRVPSHPLALALLETFGGGVAAPSANRFGRLSPTSAAHVLADLGGDVDQILDGGECPVGVESTIVAFRDGRPAILRPGMITAERIMEVLSGPLSTNKTASEVRVPGALSSHYAPRTPLSLVPARLLSAQVRDLLAQGRAIGVLSFSESPDAGLGVKAVWKTLSREPDMAARQLYASLRELDGLGLDCILVEAVPFEGSWLAIADRLQRASTPS